MGEADWSQNEDHLLERHPDVTTAMANEALNDPDRLEWNPDPGSKSGLSIKTVGYSTTARSLLTVITYFEDGIRHGATAWRTTKGKDFRAYHQEGDNR